MFVVTVTFTIDPDALEAFREAVVAQAANSLAREADCHRFDVCQNPSDTSRMFLYELYTDRTAFDRHLKSAHFRDFDARTRSWIIDKTVATWELDPGEPVSRQ